MAEGKRYFWLKLKDDFFTSKRIKKLRKLAGGDTYLIIYLKMQLKALKTDGYLKWTGLEDDFADELALDLDEEPDNVRVTLQFLMSCGLIETSDSINFLLPYTVENTGSEGASAQRVREFRARGALQSNADETHMKQLSNGEIEIEKNIEIEKEIEIEPPKQRGGVFQRFASDDKELSKALKEFNDFRNKKKKPMTDEAKRRFCRKLEKFPRNQWIPLIQQSIDQGWTDIYPLKEAEMKQTASRNAPVSNDPAKWANDSKFTEAVADLIGAQR